MTIALLAISLNLGATDPDPDLRPGFDEIAHMTLGNEFIDFDLNSPAERATLRITGPQGYTLSVHLDEAPTHITADLLLDASPSRLHDHDPDATNVPAWDALPEGHYQYELVVYSKPNVPEIIRGGFKVEAGETHHYDRTAPEADPLEEATSYNPNLLERIAGTILDLAFPSAHAGITPDDFISILDTNTPANATRVNFFQDDFDNMQVLAKDGNLLLGQGTGSSQTNTLLSLSQLGKVGIRTTAPQELLHANNPDGTAARIRIENTSNSYNLTTGGTTGFAIEQVKGGAATPFRIQPGAPTNSIRVAANGNVGLGTTTPGAALHVVGSTIKLEGSDTWNFTAFSNGVCTTNADVSGNPFCVMESAPHGTLIAAATGVGVGTFTPEAPLQVRKSDNTAAVWVTDTGALDGQTMFNLVNNGHPKFRLQDTSQPDVRWEFRTIGSGSTEGFTINKIGSGTLEMDLQAGGDVTFGGTVSGGSSREIKHGIRDIDPTSLLTKLDNLSIYEWRYDATPDQKRIGPMAEDFYQQFHLGASDKHIAPSDMAGIALAAVKSLKQENSELKDRLERLEGLLGSKG